MDIIYHPTMLPQETTMLLHNAVVHRQIHLMQQQYYIFLAGVIGFTVASVVQFIFKIYAKKIKYFCA